MPNVTSPLGTTNSVIPLVNAAQLGKAAGLHIHFATLSALTAAVVVERSNITAASPMWPTGQPFTVGPEPLGVRRSWFIGASASLSHARTVHLRPGLSIILPGDSNTVLSVSGAPSGGADGDVAVDYANNNYYLKASGTWGSASVIYPGSGSMSGSAIVSAIDAQLGSSTWQSGGVGTVDSAVTDGSTNAVSGNAVFDALAFKAPSNAPTLTDLTLAGGLTLTVTNMGSGTIINTGVIQAKTISANTAMTYGTAPAQPNSIFGVIYTNDSATPRTVTFPDTYSEDQLKTINSMVIPGNAVVRTQLLFTGTGYNIRGESWALTPKAIVYDIKNGGTNYTYTIRCWPWPGRFTASVSQSASGSCTLTTRINGVALGAAPNAVSSTRQTQNTTTAFTVAFGDVVTFAVTDNTATPCVDGQVTFLIDPDAP